LTPPLLKAVEYLLAVAGVLLLFIFVAWCLVMAGLLSDTIYLLHDESSSTRAKNKRRFAIPVVAQRSALREREKAA